MARLLLLALALCLASCSAARRSEVAASLSAAGAAESSLLDSNPAGAVLRRALLARLQEGADAPDAVRAGRRPEAEAAFRDLLRAEGRRDAPSLFVYALSVRLSVAPPAAAARLLDTASERAALDADEAADVGAAGGLPRMRLAMLQMGQGPFKFDFRWTVATSRRALPGGGVEVRYLLAYDPPPERVSMFFGLAVLEPEGTGSRWTEVLAIGSQISPPPFLEGAARAEVERILTRRARRMSAAMR